MLPGLSLPASLAGLLSRFAVCFTAPTFATFTAMVVGLVGRTSRRTVCGMWIGAGLSALVHHGRAHRFFSHARWCPDRLGLAIAALIVARFVPAGAAVEAAVDDTLFHRYGKKVHAAAWQHDGSVQGPRKIGFGNNWVIVGIVVTVPILSRPLCLPVLFRLWRPRSVVTKVDYAVELVKLLATACGARVLHVTGDAAYLLAAAQGGHEASLTVGMVRG
jgi:DDE superfamily endonuclease